MMRTVKYIAADEITSQSAGYRHETDGSFAGQSDWPATGSGNHPQGPASGTDWMFEIACDTGNLRVILITSGTPRINTEIVHPSSV
jgi:hypothetical protein